MASFKVKTELIDSESSHTICRLCMSEESLEDILKDQDLHQWISKYLSVVISREDRMSHLICTICRIRLTEFHQFRINCMEVQDVLQSLVEKENVVALEVLDLPNKVQTNQTRKEKRKYEQLQCDVCQKTFKNRRLLKDHKRNHKPKNFACSRCGKSFVYLRSLHGHLDSCHSDKRLVYENSIEFNERMQSLNEKRAVGDNQDNSQQPQQCDICKTVRSTKKKLWVHKRLVHGPKNHKCEICDYRCATLCDMRRHFKTKQHFRKLEEVAERSNSTIQDVQEKTQKDIFDVSNEHVGPKVEGRRKKHDQQEVS
ncbi:zinc finger protein 62 homolog [Armigeres subalbatus]|uniref:zinc finger protein 62 homolog n=1 Tax=Armigeres subalbatus TaxID=124917 RepID=UPI002ED315DC